MRPPIALRFFFTACVALCITYFMVNYFSLTVARSEKVIINLELGSIKRLYKARQILDQNITLNPETWINNQYALLNLNNNKRLSLSSIDELDKGHWGFITSSKQLVYRIKEPNYFMSKDGQPFIFIKIIQVEGINQLMVSDFKWCQVLSWQGCKKWD